MITLNLLNILFYFMGAFAIWGILPQDCREEIGGLVGVGLEFIWLVFCIVFFLVYHHQIIIQ